MVEGKLQRLMHLQLWHKEGIQVDVLRLSKHPYPRMQCTGGKVLSRATI